jgi:hypothetical protein
VQQNHLTGSLYLTSDYLNGKIVSLNLFGRNWFG